VLENPSNAGARNYIADAMETCRRFNLGIAVAKVTRDEDFPDAFALIPRHAAGCTSGNGRPNDR
jgi:hypothetical protein